MLIMCTKTSIWSNAVRFMVCYRFVKAELARVQEEYEAKRKAKVRAP